MSSISRFFRKYFSLFRLNGQTRKEISFLKRDSFALIIMILIPTIMVLLVRYGRIIQIHELPQIGIIDKDNSEGFTDFDASKNFTLTAQKFQLDRKIDLYLSNNETYLAEMLGKGKLNGYIIISDGFEYNLSIHWPTIITVVVDSLDILRFSESQSVIEEIVNEFREINSFTGVFNAQWFEIKPEAEAGRLFDIAPFFFPWLMFSIGCLVATQSIVSDIPKDRLVLSPVTKFEIYLAKILGAWLTMSAIAIWLAFLSITNGFTIRSDIIHYVAVLSILALAGITIGLLISAIATTPLASFQLFIFYFISQVIIVIFVPDKQILMLFPVYDGQELITKVVIRGQQSDFYSEYFFMVIGNIFVTWFAGYFIYKKKRSLI